MTLLWKTPRQWETNEAITKEKLNEISDDLTYLMTPSYGLATVRNGAANFTTASTTPVDLDPTLYGLSVELSGVRPVAVELQGQHSNGTLAAFNRFDVFIDNTTYLSSLTTTQLTSGLISTPEYVATNLLLLKLRVIIPQGVLAAGIHTFQPRVWVSAGTLTWGEVNAFSQFYVGEF